MRALVVSHEPRVRDLVRRSLGDGWEVSEAGNGAEALRQFSQARVDLVVAHQVSGNLGAFGLTRDLKIDPNPPRVIVLLERPHDEWLAKWAGADRWLLLPVGPFELADAAREVLGEAPEPSLMPTSSTEGATDEPVAR